MSRSRRQIRRALGATFFAPLTPVRSALRTSDYAWLAEDASTSGGLVNALPSFKGNITLVKSTGAGCSTPQASANLNGQLTMPAAANGGYSGILFSATPAALTVASVYRTTAANSGAFSLVTAGGSANTGLSQFRSTAVISRKISADASHASGVPINCVQVSVFTAAGVTSYMNARTPVTTAASGALAGTRATVCSLSPGGLFLLQGEWATTALWARALDNDEVGTLLTSLGALYGVTIAA